MNLSRRNHEEPELNLTSLIDVVLLLLIFFMVSTTFVDESRIELQLPQASAEPAAEQRKDPIEVAVTASGEFRVNGQTLINTSPATLSAAVSKVAGPSRDIPITLRADARATHQSRRHCHGRARQTWVQVHQHRDRQRAARRDAELISWHHPSALRERRRLRRRPGPTRGRSIDACSHTCDLTEVCSRSAWWVRSSSP